MPCQSSPFSPAIAYVWTARSKGGQWPRVRSRRSSLRSSAASKVGLEADPLLVGVDADVDDLRQVDRDLRVLGLQLEPALGALVRERAPYPVERALLHPGRQDLPALEPDVDAPALFCHQWAASTSSVSTPPVDLGCKNATRLFLMPVRGRSSISRRPAARTCSSAESMSSVP